MTRMYNKLFAKIVRSSIWLEPTPTRLIWFMFIALMDEDGFVQFASVANVAHTARVEEPEAAEAIKILESPDDNSADDANAGRRIERVPGGWMVLNASKYRHLVTRDVMRQKTRERVARHRAKLKSNADVTPSNGSVTQSDTEVQSETRVRVANNWLTEDDAWIELQKILSDQEIKKHIGLWIARIKENRGALYEAICDYKDKRNQRKVKNVGAWLTQRYQHFKGLSAARNLERS